VKKSAIINGGQWPRSEAPDKPGFLTMQTEFGRTFSHSISLKMNKCNNGREFLIKKAKLFAIGEIRR
jgi:hypothetical protein